MAPAAAPLDVPFADEQWRDDLASLATGSLRASRVFAGDALRMASLAARVPRRDGDERGSTPWTSFLREVAVARRTTDRAASSDVAVSVQLVRCMPTALALLQEGRLPVGQARALVDETLHCDDHTARTLDHELALRACDLPAWRVRREVQRLLASLDADAVAARAAQATADRDTTLTPLADDQAAVTLTGPALALAAWHGGIDAQARALRAAGDARTLAQLRFDLAVAPGTTAGWGSPGGPAAPADAGDVAAQDDQLADRRLSRPFQVLIHVPVTTSLGLSNEPGWIEGCGWISAPQVRHLLPVAELRQVCTSETGQVIDVADRVRRPPPTPGGVREALLDMAVEPFRITDKTWQEQPQHDPSPALRQFVTLRDRFDDGPTMSCVRARQSDLDHQRPYPEGPTAAWNLVARARRTHGLKHFGWIDVPTHTGTMWISPAGQITTTERYTPPPPRSEPGAVLPDPDVLHQLEAELLRAPHAERSRPVVPPGAGRDADEPPF